MNFNRDTNVQVCAVYNALLNTTRLTFQFDASFLAVVDMFIISCHGWEMHCFESLTQLLVIQPRKHTKTVTSVTKFNRSPLSVQGRTVT